MSFIVGLVAGMALGVLIGRSVARQKRLRQIGAALREGRVAITDNSGDAVAAEDFSHMLDDEFRDA